MIIFYSTKYRRVFCVRLFSVAPAYEIRSANIRARQQIADRLLKTKRLAPNDSGNVMKNPQKYVCIFTYEKNQDSLKVGKFGFLGSEKSKVRRLL